MKELPNDGFETSRGAMRLGIRTFFGFKLASRSRTKILKLKELPNDGFETSRGTLRLGIGTFLVLSSDIVGLRVQDRNLKIERATE